jgi:glucose-6-phosphate dehydrogenase assembly protein OpcA
MAMTQTETAVGSFLEGEGIPVELRDIETALVKLWGAAEGDAGESQPESPPVTRIVLANLVVEAFDRDAQSLRPVLDTVTERYPCRAIVVRGSDGLDRKIAAEVSALCHLSAPGLPQVCSERILLRAGPNAEDLVPGAVRPLLEADLPLVLWWTSDPRRREGLFRDLADESSRLILDLPDPGSEAGALRLGLDASLGTYSRDSAWFGLTRWRELVAQFFDPPCQPERLGRIASVHVEVLSPEPARPPRLAIWLVAWLAGQLGWKPPDRSPKPLASESAGALQTSLFGPAGEVAVSIESRPVPPGLAQAPRLMGLTITIRGSGADGDGFERFQMGRVAPDSPAITVKMEAHDHCRLPRLVNVPELDPACRVAAALESSRLDPPFQNALPIALWLMEYAESRSG